MIDLDKLYSHNDFKQICIKFSNVDKDTLLYVAFCMGLVAMGNKNFDDLFWQTVYNMKKGLKD